MKLVRFGPPGREKPGLIDAEGVLRDLSRKVADIDAKTLAPVALSGLRKLDARRLPAVRGKPRLGPCIATPSKFVAIGLNYSDHARETGSPIPENPVVFFKSQTCIVGAKPSVRSSAAARATPHVMPTLRAVPSIAPAVACRSFGAAPMMSALFGER